MNLKELTWNKLDQKDKRLFQVLLATVFIFSIVETLGIGSFMPFLSILSNPNSIKESEALSLLHRSLGGGDQLEFALKVGVGICLLMIFRAFLLFFLTWFKVTYSNMVFRKLSTKLLNAYLTLPYSYFLSNNTSAMLKNVTKEITSIRTALLILIELVTNLVCLIAIIGFLFYIDPNIVYFAATYSLVVILVISKLTKKKILKEGKASELSYRHVFKAGKQALDGIKEIKQTQTENFFIKAFEDSILNYTNANINIHMLQKSPVIALELLTYLSFFGVVFYLTKSRENFVAAIPILGMLAMAVKRVVPALNSINGGLAKLRSLRPGLEIINQVFTEEKKSEIIHNDPKFKFEKRISFENLSFTYLNSDQKVLDNVSFSFPKGAKVGIVGGSGSGKTTLLDIFLGLHQNYEGDILVDGKKINLNNHGSLQKITGYIPQQIYLLDDTIKSNIAFGLDEKAIKIDKVQECSKTAQIFDLVSSLPQRFENIIGDRGLKLSGGERQRMGIARAIYRDPDILVLDEATSALDNIIEAEFQKAIKSYAKNKTLLIIAHRLTTVKNCDVIFILNKGKLEASGTYESLEKSSEYFQKLIQPDNETVRN